MTSPTPDLIPDLAPQDFLGTYGTLASGRANHHQLDGWKADGHATRSRNARKRRLGRRLRLPRPRAQSGGPAVEVAAFESADLPAHSSRLDEFEGPGYVRVATTVSNAPGQIEAFIYVLRSQPSTS